MKEIVIEDKLLPITRLRKYFALHDNIYAAYLFGSYARGQQQKDSDIDILVTLKYADSSNKRN